MCLFCELEENLSDENIRKNCEISLRAGNTVKGIRNINIFLALRRIFKIAREYNFKVDVEHGCFMENFILPPITDKEKVVRKSWLEILGFSTDEAEAFDNNRKLQQTIEGVNKVVSSMTNGTSTVENIDDLNDFIYKAAIPLWINAMQCKSVFQPQIEIPLLNNNENINE